MSNEAAERLRDLASNSQVPDGNLMDVTVGEFRDALAAERRATVERLTRIVEAVQEKDRSPRTEFQNGYSVAMAEFRAILEEAAR